LREGMSYLHPKPSRRIIRNAPHIVNTLACSPCCNQNIQNSQLPSRNFIITAYAKKVKLDEIVEIC